MSKRSSKPHVAIEPFDARSYNRAACRLSQPIFLKAMMTPDEALVKFFTGMTPSFNTFLPLN